MISFNVNSMWTNRDRFPRNCARAQKYLDSAVLKHCAIRYSSPR